MRDMPLSEFILKSVEDLKTLLLDDKYKVDMGNFFIPKDASGRHCSFSNSHKCIICFGGTVLAKHAEGDEAALEDFSTELQGLAESLDEIRDGDSETALRIYHDDENIGFINDRRHRVRIDNEWVEENGMEAFYAEMQNRAEYLKTYVF